MFLPGVKSFFLVPPLLGLLILASLALISFRRGRRYSTNYFFAGVCLLGAVLNGNTVVISLVESPQTALFIYRLAYVFFVFTLPLYIQFTHAFLGLCGRRLLEITAYGISLIFLCFLPTDLFFDGFYEYDFGRVVRGGPLFSLFAVMAIGSVIYCLAGFIQAERRAVDNQQRNRIKYIIGGLGLGTLLMSFNILPVSGLPVYPLGNFNFMPGVVLAYGVLKYDLLDIGVLIRRGTVYFILTGILAGVYIFLVYVLGYFLMTSGYQKPLLALMLAITIVFLFEPLKTKIQKWLEKIFFMGRYDYREVLKEISGLMCRMHRREEIRDLLMDSIIQHIGLKSLCLIIRTDSNGEPCFYQRGDVSILDRQDMEREKMDNLIHGFGGLSAAGSLSFLEHSLPDGPDKVAAIAFVRDLSCVAVVPLIAKDRILGVILPGEKKSGELLVHEDLEMLMTMANQAVTAFENAVFFEKLENLNRDLEIRIAARTAALRTALEEKDRTTAQLIRSESLAAIGQLVAGAAHELNNPLASASSLVQSAVEAMKKPFEGEEESKELIDDLDFTLKELKRAGDIVRSLLGLSRQTDNYREPIKLHDLIEDALRVLHNYYHNLPIVIEKHYETTLPEVTGNFSALGQVVVNILKNAFQSLPESGGTIVLCTGYDHMTGERSNGIGDKGLGGI